MDIKNRSLRLLPANTSMTVTFMNVNEMIPYSFETKVVGQQKKLMMLERPNKIYRNQRRSFARVPVGLPIHVLISDKTLKKIFVIRAETRNLSGGGVLINTDKAGLFSIDKYISLHFKFRMNEQVHAVSCKAEIVDFRKDQDISQNAKVALKFLNIQDRDRLRLIQFLYMQEIELHKKFSDGKI